jgi:hypothetical protein
LRNTTIGGVAGGALGIASRLSPAVGRIAGTLVLPVLAYQLSRATERRIDQLSDQGDFSTWDAFALASGDVLGITGLVEGYNGLDVVTGRRLGEEEAGAKLGGSIGMYAGLAAGSYAFGKTYAATGTVQDALDLDFGGTLSKLPGANSFLTEDVGQLAVKGYIRLSEGTAWRSYYDSFSPGTANLRFSFLGGRQLFRAHDLPIAARFGRFASLDRPYSPLDAISGNALDPVLTHGNMATKLFDVTTRSGFFIEGEVAPQGILSGGFRQVYRPKLFGRLSPWRDVSETLY